MNSGGRRLCRAVFFLWLWLIAGCATPPGKLPLLVPEVGRPTIRVLLGFTQDDLEITCRDRYQVRGQTKDGGEVVYYCSRPCRLSFARGGWEFAQAGGATLETDLLHAVVFPENDDHPLSVAGRQYPGALIFQSATNGPDRPQIINRVYLEDYLLGVLPPELGKRSSDEREAVKAQAVAARTYALARLGQYPNAEYDLRDDHMDQVYVGLNQVDKVVDNAVRETSGEVLTYQDDLIQAYYHSTCAGSTDDIEAVWERAPVPYLVAREDTFCRWSKYDSWQESWSGAALLDRLCRYVKTDTAAPFRDFQRIVTLRVVGRTSGGRVKRMVVSTDRGEWSINGDRLRWALGRPSTGGPILQSANVELFPEYTEDGYLVRLDAVGRGYGHGVGMCQCGMIGRARAGHDYRSILAYFYQGTAIKKMY